MSDPIVLNTTLIPPIRLKVSAADPILLSATQSGIGVGPAGPPGPAGQIFFGDKSSLIDPGNAGDISLGDDYVYFCTQTGTAGNAKWKKSPLFIST